MVQTTDHNSYWRDFPATYRSEQVQQIARWVATGESGVIVGCSGAGKSNLVGFISAHADILGADVGLDQSSLIVLNFDINSLPLLTVPYFYRGILQSILNAAIGLPSGSGEIADLQALPVQSGDWNDAFFALATLNRALEIMVGRRERHVVLLLDRFDEACRQLDSQALSALRSLRDRFKGRLVYIAATRHPLERLRPPAEIDEFYELIAGNTCWVGAMGARDANWLVEQMADRLDVVFAEQDVSRLIEICGGLPTFMKSGCIALAEGSLHGGQPAAQWIETLLARPEFQRNCRELWDDMDGAEQSTLLQAAQGGGPVGEQSGLLVHAGLLIQRDGRHQLFSPIFAEYILTQHLLSQTSRRNTDVTPAGLDMDLKSGAVIRDGQVLDVVLTNQEHRLLEYLLSRSNEICTKDEIMAAVWPDDLLVDGVRDDRLAQLVKRLRDKIEPDASPPTYVQTVRGRGYRLMQPADQGPQTK
jgi:DNA-binding winged helix-turn-helix (wHTH) protein